MLSSFNVVGNANSLIEKIRVKAGRYFNYIKVLEINIYLQRKNLKETK